MDKKTLLQWLNERYDKELQWMNWAEHFVGKHLPSMRNFEYDRQMWKFLIALCESIEVDEHDNA